MPTTMTYADLRLADGSGDRPLQTVAVLDEPYRLRLAKAEIPTPKDDEIRIRVVYVGICGSDLEAFRGNRQPEFITFPARLGHEVAGIIDAVGTDVRGLKPGMKVACRYVWGAYAQYIVCRPFNVQVMPDEFDMKSLSLIEIIPGVIHTAELADIDSGTTVLIMGQGVSGLMLTQVIALYSPARLVVTDLKERNLALARRYGATDTVQIPDPEAVTAEYLKERYPEGFDVVIPCLLEGDCVMDAVNCTRIGGRVVLYGGIGTAEGKFDFFKVHRKRTAIISTEPRRDIDMYRYFKESVSLVKDGLIQTDSYIDRIYPLSEIQQAFEERNDKANDSIHILIDTAEDSESREEN
jgi:L-iditol 2-dehydrogenase